jgi:hypothetical protein
MSDLRSMTKRVNEAVELLSSAVMAAFLATVVVILLFIIGLVAAGAYGIVHEGDDFGRFGNSDGGGSGGDVIVLPGIG